MKYFFNTKLGDTRYRLADGSLLCKDVPIARTGEQQYSAADLPDLEPDATGMITVERSADEVFSEATLASFEGMSITIDHPADTKGGIVFVGPENWRDLSHGHMQNIRRGTGDQSDLMLADMIFKTAESIEAIENGLREISCGYDAHYEQLSAGRAKQIQITGNHGALVVKGRAGSRCAIGDKDTMQHKKKTGFLALFAKAVKTGDADDIAELAEMASGDSDTPPNYSLPPQKPEQETLDSDRPAWVDELLAAIKGLSPKTGDSDDDEKTEDSEDEDKEKSGDSDDEDKTTDSEDDEEEGQVTGDSAYRADLIVPGFDIPKKAKPTAFKRDVLKSADKQLVRQVVGDSAISKMPKQAIDMAFNAVSEIAKSRNTRGRTTDAAPHSSSATPASLNQAARDFWSKK